MLIFINIYIKDMKNKLVIKLFTIIFALLIIRHNVLAMEFSDISHGFWAYQEIDKMTDEGIISGYPDGNFMPNQLVTRAQYAAMIIKALRQEDITIETMYSFEDIDASHWAWKYVLQALNLDILKPCSDGYFCPNDYVTRSEIITFLVNLLKTEDITKKEAIIALQNAYTDFDDIPDWFKPTAGKAEIINVIAKEPPRQNYLDYDSYITRAQMAVFLANMKRETDSYIAEKIKEETSPKIAEGIILENIIQDGDVVTILQKSVLPIMIIGQISTKNAYPGQMFQARFANNIVDYEHHLLFSKDIILIGKILDTTTGKTFIRNGELMFELSAVNNKNLLTKILGAAECEAYLVEANKVKKAAKTVLKGREFTAKDGQILYVRLYKPIRVNIVTGEVFD